MDVVGRRWNIERKTRPMLLAQNKSICYPSPFAFNSCHGNRETRTGFPNWIRKNKKKNWRGFLNLTQWRARRKRRDTWSELEEEMYKAVGRHKDSQSSGSCRRVAEIWRPPLITDNTTVWDVSQNPSWVRLYSIWPYDSVIGLFFVIMPINTMFQFEGNDRTRTPLLENKQFHVFSPTISLVVARREKRPWQWVYNIDSFRLLLGRGGGAKTRLSGDYFFQSLSVD